MDISLTRISNSGVQYLRFAERTFDKDGIESGNRVAFKAIHPDHDPLKALEAAKNRVWKFGTRNQQNGQYDINPVAAVAGAQVVGEGERKDGGDVLDNASKLLESTQA